MPIGSTQQTRQNQALLRDARRRTRRQRALRRTAAPATAWRVVGLLATACVAACISGCATVGAEFPVAPVDEIIIGQTTQSDIQRMFGNPWRTGVDDGDTTWTYGHYKYKLWGRARTRDLVVRFDANGVVSSYTFNTTEHEDRATARNTP